MQSIHKPRPRDDDPSWKGGDARAAFIAFVSTPFNTPEEIKRISIANGTHRGGSPIAIAEYADGRRIRIKVVRSRRVIAAFRRSYPGIPVVIAVERNNSRRDVIKILLTELKRLL